jgi:hypothetical protein
MSKINRVLLLAFMILTSTMSVSFAKSTGKKIKMKVLYVGFNPEKPMPETNSFRAPHGFSPERFKESYKTRMPAFVSLLEENFTNVKAVDPREYRQAMSADYDVTIFDEAPKPIKEMVREFDENGQISKYEKPIYITEDYDHATIFIGDPADRIGRSVGSKLDWLCLCLDADAFNIDKKHTIFNTPNNVELTMKLKDTPDNVFAYESGSKIAKQIPMWRVQKEGYLEGKGYRIGMVSRSGGFMDSPDVEYISGGVSAKNYEAVAIGRHGNFFLWGFSASPDYMTDEAKKVFVNAVVYMKQFKGVKPIARKYNDRIVIRDEYVNGMISTTSQKGFQKTKAYYQKVNKGMAENKKKLEEKKARGEKLSMDEQMAIKMKPMHIPTFEEHLQKGMGEYFQEYNGNTRAFHQFLEENREFFYFAPGTRGYKLNVDEDVKKLNVSNRKPEMLEKCIKLLSKGEQTDMANRILKRYTEENFATAKEWKKWLKKNRSKLFFTESGGYKWLVNTLR